MSNYTLNQRNQDQYLGFIVETGYS